MADTWQQNSSTSISWAGLSPTCCSTRILLALPRMLSYRVPLGIPNLRLAWVNLSCCLITQSMAWNIWLWVQAGTLLAARASLLLAPLPTSERRQLYSKVWRKLFIISCAQVMTDRELEQLVLRSRPGHAANLAVFLKSVCILRTLNLSHQDYLLLKTTLLHTPAPLPHGPLDSESIENIAATSIFYLFFKDYIQKNDDLEHLVLNMIF